MNIITRELPVDTNTIAIIDVDYLLDRKELRDAQVFKVPPGRYTLNARVSVFPPKRIGVKDRVFTVTSGEVWIGDPCQMVKDSEWEEWLRATSYHKVASEQAVFIDVHEDGGYVVYVDLTESK